VPFFAVLILGIILTVRCGHRFGMQNTLSFWLATIAGLCYLGGASIVLVQMVLALMVTGFSAGVFLTLFFALIPIILWIWTLRVARSKTPQSINKRLLLGITGLKQYYWNECGYIYLSNKTIFYNFSILKNWKWE
jgi:cadmium resistance protein CadD (predicted permease)